MAFLPPGYTHATPLVVTAGDAVGGSATTPVGLTSTDHCVRLYLTGASALAVQRACVDGVAGSDLTVWHGSSQIDVDVETFSASAISLWFKLQAGIAAGATDRTYTLAYGSAVPVVKQNWANIYPLADDFTGTSLDTSKWTNYNGCNLSFASSVITLVNSTTMDIPHNNCAVQSVANFPLSYAIRARGTMPLPAITGNIHVHNSIRFINGDSSQLAGGVLRMDAFVWSDPANAANTTPPDDSTHWLVSSFSDDSSGHFSAAAVLTPIDSAVHTFNLGRNAAGNAYGWIDEGVAGHTTSQPTVGALHVWLSPGGDNIPNTTIQTWDWCKVRPYVVNEPVVGAGATLLAAIAPASWLFG